MKSPFFSTFTGYKRTRLTTPILYTIYIVVLNGLTGESAIARDYSDVFKKVDPAVVVIYTQESGKERSTTGLVSTSSEGLGSGVIISPDGRILTASHVVHSADKVSVELYDGRKYRAKVISTLAPADLGLIQIVEPPKELAFILPGDSDKVKIGEEVFIIGAPYGLTHTLTVGHISSRRLNLPDSPWDNLEFLQTDASLNEGNSGGPMLTANGELIGIASSILSQSGGSEGLGFVASINMAKRLILDQPHIWSGITFTTLDKDLLRMLNVREFSTGLLVQHVSKGSLAEKFGVRAGSVPAKIYDTELLLGGDIIIKFGENLVSKTEEEYKKIRDYYGNVRSGEDLELTIVREGKVELLRAKKP